MTLDEFKHNVEIHSADLTRWPQGLVKLALARMETDAEARAFFDAHLGLDAQLRLYAPAPQALAALETRIMQAVAKESPAVPAAAAGPQWRAGWVFAPSGGLLAAALIGFIIGFNPQPQAQPFAPLDPAYVAEQQLASADSYIYDAFDGEVF